ncbi:MAG: FxDxF family PEP-CTERM protein [Pseudomonadota bacterium]
MKQFINRTIVAAAVVAGGLAMSAAQAADVSHGAKALVFVGGNTNDGAGFGKTVLAGSTFTDVFTFSVASATGHSTFSNFQVSSDAQSALLGMDLSNFTLSGPVNSAGSMVQTGVSELWKLPTLDLLNGNYTISVSGITVSKPGGSYALSGKLVSAVPEPATYGMLGLGLGMVGLMARRQRRRGQAA